jgi:hypothetical protein
MKTCREGITIEWQLIKNIVIDTVSDEKKGILSETLALYDTNLLIGMCNQYRTNDMDNDTNAIITKLGQVFSIRDKAVIEKLVPHIQRILFLSQ